MKISKVSFFLCVLIVNIFVFGMNPKAEAQNIKITDQSPVKEIAILANQVAYNLDGPKTAIIPALRWVIATDKKGNVFEN